MGGKLVAWGNEAAVKEVKEMSKGELGTDDW